MTIVKQECPDCNQYFEYEPNPKFPRKYCSPCGAARKKSWDEGSKAPMPASPAKPAPQASEGKYALTIGNVRSNALTSAIKALPKESPVSMVLSIAGTFEDYILNGNAFFKREPNKE